MELKYKAWKTHLTEQIKSKNIDEELNHINKNLLEELEHCMKSQNAQEELYERFYKDVEFGTGGLRGILGVGTNRMNLYTVAKATQGIAEYIKAGEYLKDSPIKGKTETGKPAVAIAYDSRINSKVFAQTAARVLNASHIDVYLYRELMPTPALSFAVRRYGCAMGIMITASHNPAQYNGYKVYDNSGCQVTLEAAEKIFSYIEKTDIFADVKTSGGTGSLCLIGDEGATEYLDAVQAESTCGLPGGVRTDAMKNLCVVYTPLNGAGNKSVQSILSRIGIEKVNIVKEQENSDGNFPTCPYPNPEKKEALALGLEYCFRLKKEAEGENKPEDIPDLLLATDPDCDRVGIAIRDRLGKTASYKLLTGNQVGILLLDFLLTVKVESGIKKNPCIVTTVVSTKMAEAIAKKHNIKMIVTLTGFKFIGEQIAFLENQHREHEYLFGFEESYGYLSGTYVRDKDAVNGAMLICEMAAFYKEKGMTLQDRLTELYEEYGYYKEKLVDFAFDGSKGMEKMNEIMKEFRENLANKFVGSNIKEIYDYKKNVRALPKTDMIEVILRDGQAFTIRPSGTEPKIKIYLSAKGNTPEETDMLIDQLEVELRSIVNRK